MGTRWPRERGKVTPAGSAGHSTGWRCVRLDPTQRNPETQQRGLPLGAGRGPERMRRGPQTRATRASWSERTLSSRVVGEGHTALGAVRLGLRVQGAFRPLPWGHYAQPEPAGPTCPPLSPPPGPPSLRAPQLPSPPAVWSSQAQPQSCGFSLSFQPGTGGSGAPRGKWPSPLNESGSRKAARPPLWGWAGTWQWQPRIPRTED